MAHCSSVTPGGPAALQCLQQHASSAFSVLPAGGERHQGAGPAAKAKAPPAKAETAAAPAPTAAAPAETAAPAAPAAPAKAAKAQSKKAQLAAVAPRLRRRLPHALPRHSAGHRRGGRLSEAQRGDVVGGVPARARRRRGRQVEVGGCPAATPRCRAARPLPHRRQPEPPPLLVSPREEMFILRTSCRRDYMQFCRGLRFGAGRVASCLHYNAANLSPPCQAALAALREGR